MPRHLEQVDEYILAAFMAGDLPQSLRQEIMAYIASSDKARDLLSMAYDAMDAAESGDGASRVLEAPSTLPPRPSRKGQLANVLRSRFNERHLWKVTALFAGSVLVLAIIVAVLVLDQSRSLAGNDAYNDWTPHISWSVQAADLETTLARARREGAWIAPTSDVLTWWRRRDQVRPVIAAIGRDEMHLDLINDSETPLSGLVMEIRGREGQYKSLRISGGEGSTQYVEELDVTYVFLPTLDIGANRVTLTWRR